MTDKTELKPCPFCGGEVQVFSTGDEPRNIAYVECTYCYIRGQQFEQLREWEVGTHIEAAIKAWNTRHQPKPADSEFRDEVEYPAKAIEHIKESKMDGDYMLTIHGQAREQIINYCESVRDSSPLPQMEGLVEALKYYADHENYWKPHDGNPKQKCQTNVDTGAAARQALAALEGGE